MALGVANALYATWMGCPGSSRRTPEDQGARASRGAGAARRRSGGGASRGAAGRGGHGARRGARGGAVGRGGNDRGAPCARRPRLACARARRVIARRPGRARPAGDRVGGARGARPPRFATGTACCSRSSRCREARSGGIASAIRTRSWRRAASRNGAPRSCAIRRSAACRCSSTTSRCRPSSRGGPTGQRHLVALTRMRSAHSRSRLRDGWLLSSVRPRSRRGSAGRAACAHARGVRRRARDAAAPLDRAPSAGRPRPGPGRGARPPGGCAGDLRGRARPAREGLPAEREKALLASASVPQRAAAAGAAGPEQAGRLADLLRNDPAPEVRVAALRRLGAPRGSRLPRHAARRFRRRGRNGAEGGRRARGGVRPRRRAAVARRGHALALAGLPDRRAGASLGEQPGSRGRRSSSSPISTRTNACARSPRSRSAAGSATRTRARARAARASSARAGSGARARRRARQEALARPGLDPEAREVRRRDLAVEEREVPGLELLDERRRTRPSRRRAGAWNIDSPKKAAPSETP